MKSTKWLMERTIAKQTDPSLYDVKLFPISRGVDQYAIMRKPIKPLRLCLLYLSKNGNPPGIPDSFATKFGMVVRERSAVDSRSLFSQLGKDAVHKLFESDAEGVVFVTEGHEPANEAGLWEAQLLLELHADVAAAAGRITDKDGKILSSCTSPAAELTATPSWIGMKRTDPGTYALALKRQTATTITADYFICRTDILREALESKIHSDSTSLAKCIALIARKRSLRLAYSPLIEAIRKD